MKPQCKLVGTDGNAFSVIGNVSRTLKKAGKPAQAKEFCDRAMRAENYYAIFAIADEYVTIE